MDSLNGCNYSYKALVAPGEAPYEAKYGVDGCVNYCSFKRLERSIAGLGVLGEDIG